MNIEFIDKLFVFIQSLFMAPRILSLIAHDVRFPTSDFSHGSDAMNPDPDYSAAVAIVETDEMVNGQPLSGHGLTFTIGRGTEICVAAIRAFEGHLVGRDLDEIAGDLGAFWRSLAGDSQLRWLGPEKGVIHLAMAAVVNAVWDLLARRAGVPLWQYMSDMSPEEIVRCVDFRHISDVLSPEAAIELLEAKRDGRAQRVAHLEREGYPAYVTSAGWLGYDEATIRTRCREAVADGWTHFKIKVGKNLESDLERCRFVREEIGPERKLMVDANQVWEVDEAIEWSRALLAYDLWWIEEPTSPDDILGHARIAEAIRPVGVATGEHCHNRVMVKQLLQAGAVDFLQIDGCRLGGVNEVIAAILLAAKFDVPVCPHAGGVGLCEHVQHFSAFDYICVSGSLDRRITEFADHLHEHFIHPVEMKAGRYVLPTSPGLGVEFKKESLARFSFPDGPVWKERARQ
jgi:L-fuconate dehydratase